MKYLLLHLVVVRLWGKILQLIDPPFFICRMKVTLISVPHIILWILNEIVYVTSHIYLSVDTLDV